MHKWAMLIGFIVLAACGFVGRGSSADAADLDLVGLLTRNLGVTTKQAEGGAGAIFEAASHNMRAEDFTKVTDALPEVGSLMRQYVSGGSGAGTPGGLSAMLGKGGSSLASLAGLTDAFSKLGLSSDMVGKFIPIILEYAQSKGGRTIADLLQAALP